MPCYAMDNPAKFRDACAVVKKLQVKGRELDPKRMAVAAVLALGVLMPDLVRALKGRPDWDDRELSEIAAAPDLAEIVRRAQAAGVGRICGRHQKCSFNFPRERWALAAAKSPAVKEIYEIKQMLDNDILPPEPPAETATPPAAATPPADKEIPSSGPAPSGPPAEEPASNHLLTPASTPAEEPACSIPQSALRTPHLPLPPAESIDAKIARCLTPKPRRKNDFDIDMSESNPSRERGAAKRMLALAETMLPVLIDEINALYRSKLTLPTPPAGKGRKAAAKPQPQSVKLAKQLNSLTKTIKDALRALELSGGDADELRPYRRGFGCRIHLANLDLMDLLSDEQEMSAADAAKNPGAAPIYSTEVLIQGMARLNRIHRDAMTMLNKADPAKKRGIEYSDPMRWYENERKTHPEIADAY